LGVVAIAKVWVVLDDAGSLISRAGFEDSRERLGPTGLTGSGTRAVWCSALMT
jgi:hypothetical protein